MVVCRGLRLASRVSRFEVADFRDLKPATRDN